jgi:hypothetical protein
LSKAPSSWQPHEITGFVDRFDTACSVLLVDTNAGRGYLKAMGNLAGNHALACEWVGTGLAKHLRLPAFDISLIEVRPDVVLHFARGGSAKAGPAVILRAERGDSWSGGEAQLENIENPEAITRLVVFDTWVRNQDRRTPSGDVKNLDNVFLSVESQKADKLVLRAIDHTHCFIPRHEISFELKAGELSDQAIVEDTGIYGLFPEFHKFIDLAELRKTLDELSALKVPSIESLVSNIPAEWQVSPQVRTALVDFLVHRRQYVVDTMEVSVAKLIG